MSDKLKKWSSTEAVAYSVLEKKYPGLVRHGLATTLKKVFPLPWGRCDVSPDAVLYVSSEQRLWFFEIEDKQAVTEEKLLKYQWLMLDLYDCTELVDIKLIICNRFGEGEYVLHDIASDVV